ncbi:MAG TPA: anthrone oxygenase family protein [Methyloceanibacter sp.]|jgi:uncharacterized membrane protein|nr:anthrone oxygenase family protein [Methyloceanibacter sp.]
MDRLLFAVTFLCAIGAGLIGGLFFAFSSFVMTALGRVQPAAGISAMQSINVAVLNPLFFAAFFGTAALCVVALIVALMRWSEPGAGYLLAGGLLYLIGTILVTMAGNVPLNNKLARVRPDSSEGAQLWTQYLSTWTAWNHLRTIASLAAAASFILALVRLPGSL